MAYTIDIINQAAGTSYVYDILSLNAYIIQQGGTGGIGMPSKTGTEAGIQAQGMALQLANVASQTRLNESQADKNEADAEKTRGVDTKAQEATIVNLIAQTSNEKVKKGLILGQIDRKSVV